MIEGIRYDKNVVVSKMEITTPHGAIEGKTQTNEASFYSLDAIIAVGYRVSSAFNVIFAPMEEVRAHITGKTTLTVTPESVTINQIHEYP